MVMYQLSIHCIHIRGNSDSIADTLLIHGIGCLSVTRKHQLILTNHLKILTYLRSIKLNEIYSKLTAGSQDRSTEKECLLYIKYSLYIHNFILVRSKTENFQFSFNTKKEQ